MPLVDLLIGSSIGQRIVIVGTIVLYASLVIRRPEAARESFAGGARMLVGLATLVIAALLLASAVETLVPASAISSLVGESAGPEGVVLAGLLGGVLPGDPYATYPVIQRIQESGAGTPAVLTMLLGYGLISIGRVPYGLVFFTPRVVVLRLLAAGTATLVVGVTLFALGAILRNRSAEASGS